MRRSDGRMDGQTDRQTPGSLLIQDICIASYADGVRVKSQQLLLFVCSKPVTICLCLLRVCLHYLVG